MIPIDLYKDRDVAVFGLARSGIAAAKALAAGGARVHAWDDSAASRAAAEAAGVTLSDIDARDWRKFAALVLSPGVPLDYPEPHRIVELARGVGVPIVGDIELFARAVAAKAPHARPKVIGVTGTNGKSTTTALLGHILKSAGKDARVGGNIGTAVLDLAPLHAGAIYVLELSSYQLDLTESLRCDAAILLNVTPDHLDRHGGMENYVAAKKRVFRNQGAGDWAIVGIDDSVSAAMCTELRGGETRNVVAVSNRQALGRGVSALGGRLYDAIDGRTRAVFDLKLAPNLPGLHNAQNAAAAYAAARAMGLTERQIANGLETFPGLPHRLENVATIAEVRFINDSKATNSDAAAQALAAYPRVYWIAGGVAKEGGIENLGRLFPRVAKAYLVGASAAAFAETLSAAKVPYTVTRDLGAATAQAFLDARESDERDPIVLLSPAAASFDQFRDFEHRGDAFKAAVAALAQQVDERNGWLLQQPHTDAG